MTAASAATAYSSGKKLADLADLAIDTHAPRGEPLVDVDGLVEQSSLLRQDPPA